VAASRLRADGAERGYRKLPIALSRLPRNSLVIGLDATGIDLGASRSHSSDQGGRGAERRQQVTLSASTGGATLLGEGHEARRTVVIWS
jgi:hypothetical protein